MFTFLNKAYIAIVALLGAIIVFQYYSIVSLEDKAEEQAQMLEKQSETIKSLKQQEELNQKLTLEVSRLESEARSKSDEAIESISEQERITDAYNANAPRAVVEFLRK